MLRARRVWVAVAAALLLTTACSSDGKKNEPQTFSSYVAMGDSSVSGPGISPLDQSSGACSRSLENWPALLAASLDGDPELTDVSCGGAVTSDILTARPASTAFQPDAQLKPVSKDTDLVTISIGGNDEGLYSKIILACLAGPYASDAACKDLVDTKLGPILTRTTDRVATTLERIRAKAPSARILLVGYVRLFPADGACSSPGIPAARIGPAVAAWVALDKALETAAERVDEDYLSMSGRSRRHASCDDKKAWANGLKVTTGDGAVLHPNAAGMRAVAKLVAAHLKR